MLHHSIVPEGGKSRMEKEREGGVKRNFVRRETDSKAVFTKVQKWPQGEPETRQQDGGDLRLANRALGVTHTEAQICKLVRE